MKTTGFWRLALIERVKGESKHVGFSYHYGSRRHQVDTGIRELHVPGGNAPQIKRGEREYRTILAALEDWKAEHAESV